MFWILCIVGLILRVYQLDSQIICSDEWHLIYDIRSFSWWYNITHFHSADSCVPLTIFAHVLQSTVGVNEFGLRFLPFLSGAFIIFLGYGLVKRVFNKRIALIFTALIVISPLLIYYSRYVRPYSIVALLSFIAVFAFYEWIKTGKRSYAGIYIITSVFAVYFHLFALPIVVSPLLVSFALLFLEQRNKDKKYILKMPSLGKLLIVGIGVLFGIALWLIPLLSSVKAIVDKMGKDHFLPDTFFKTVALFSGSGDHLIIAFFVVFFIYGAICLYRENIFLFLTILTMIFLFSLSVMTTMPIWIKGCIVLARYGISLLLFFLLPVAIGLHDFGVRILIKSRFQPGKIMFLAGIGLFVILFLKGPIPNFYYYPNSLTNWTFFQYDYCKRILHKEGIKRSELQFYNSLSSQSQVHAIVEYPYSLDMLLPYCSYQYLHRKRVLIGEDHKEKLAFLKKNIHLSNYVDIEDPDSWRARASYLVIHSHVVSKFEGMMCMITGNFKQEIFSDRYEGPMRNFLLRLSKIYGQPVYQDDYIVVFKS